MMVKIPKKGLGGSVGKEGCHANLEVGIDFPELK